MIVPEIPSEIRNRGPSPVSPARDGAIRIIATAAVLAILYLGRDVLVPVTLAVILSLLIAPLVRWLRRIGLGSTFSVLAAVLGVALAFVGIATVIGSQLVRLAANLPLYEARIRHKAEVVQEMSVRRVSAVLGDAGLALFNPPVDVNPAPGVVNAPPAAPTPAAATGTLQFAEKMLASIWVPLETAGTVLVVLIFVLLEREALRDRLIRIAGSADIRTSTNVINDAGERLSRFFVSQFAVNVGVGATLWLGLAVIRLPHALLWATLATVLRFVPYLGIWIAALLSALFAAAVIPGWSLMFAAVALFVIVELLAGQLVEPQLFGHTTGLSPLSVVIAAVFWSWLWGPIGLIVSTPLTLCLLVAGRHVPALNLLDILLGDTPALTMPQRLYQRALSGDADEIIAGARLYLKRNTLATYCDLVLMPAMYLAGLDFVAGTIDKEQQIRVRNAVVNVIASLGTDAPARARRRKSSVLDDASLGRALREQRERLSGRWQGPLDVPPGSVTLCVGLGSTADELATEILVRIFISHRLDARHVALADLRDPVPSGASADSVAIVYIVSAYPKDEPEQTAEIAREIRQRLPACWIVALFLPGLLAKAPLSTAHAGIANVDQSAISFRDAEELRLDWQRKHAPV